MNLYKREVNSIIIEIVLCKFGKEKDKMGLFNRATNAVEVMGKNVSKAAKDNMEIVRCSSAIDACEQKVKNVYEEIGKRYYYAESEVAREAFADLFAEIQDNENQIKALKDRLQVLKGVEICKECGAELKKGTNFCQWCGARVEREAPAPVYVFTCPNCNSPLKGEEKFCAVCGAPVEQELEKAKQATMEPEEKTLTCPKCGEVLKDTDAFCKNCGTPVNKVTEEQDKVSEEQDEVSD